MIAEKVKEELIEVRNRIDELINQLVAEVDNTFMCEESLENIIFHPKLFNRPANLTAIKQAIGRFIAIHPVKGEKKIDAKSRNQFFYLYAALWSLPNVLADDSMVKFVRQMALWFPEWLSADKKELRNYEQSLSHEKKKWEKDNELLNVTQWYSFIKGSSMSVNKAKHFHALAMEIYTTINTLVKNVRKE